MKFAQPKNSNYYDLVRIPHGHIPAPRIRFWAWLPIPIKGMRTWNTFYCPTCGSPSFFKARGYCDSCGPDFDDNEQMWKSLKKKEAVRNRWKRFEEIILPLLILLGKAWYMPSERLTYAEQWKKYGPPIQFEYDEEEDDEEELLNELTGDFCSICNKALTEEDEFGAPDHPQCCEEHGDFLNLCGECWETWMMKCQDPAEGCIREWFKNRRIPIEVSLTSKGERIK